MTERKRHDHDRIDALIREVASGEQERDTLPNSSYRLEKEAQAMYFSNMRRNMQSRIAAAIVRCNSDLSELKVMEALK